MIWFGGAVAAAATVTAESAPGAAADALTASIEQRVNAATEPLLTPGLALPSATAYRDRVRTEIWTEVWPDAAGKAETRTVTGELWTATIQASLDQHKAVFLPGRAAPYYLDRPIVLSSGCRLLADPRAEIRLKPGTSTCMVRNEHVAGFQDRPVPADLQPDTDILIQGGIWTTLATMPGQNNGNGRGRADSTDSVPGCHGVILLQNVQRAVVRDLTIRQGVPFGVHLGTAREFLVENLTFEDHRRDGVHCDGPASFGIIRGIRGKTGDDPVSLLSWDWQQYSASFGPIHHILVQDVSGAPLAAQSTDAIRLLPGVKRFAGGATLDCPIRDCVLRDLADIREFKLYDQPNLELGRDHDSSAKVGELRNVLFEHLTFSRPGSIHIHADTDGLTVRDVALNFPVTPDYRLVLVGPPSATYKHKPDDPTQWTEVFSPDRDCRVRNLRIEEVHALRGDKLELLADPYSLVTVIQQTTNPDYPKTTPRGGVGKALLLP
jgi:hypothetical protein